MAEKFRRIPNIADEMLPEIVAGQAREILRAQAATVSQHADDFYRYNLSCSFDQSEVVMGLHGRPSGQVSVLYTHRLFDDAHDMIAIRFNSRSPKLKETFCFREVFIDYKDRVLELETDLSIDDQQTLRLNPASREILQLLRTLQGVMIQQRENISN